MLATNCVEFPHLLLLLLNLMEPFRILFVFIVLFLLFDFSSSSSLIIDSTNEFHNYTAISDFRLINRRSLIQCPDPNPFLQINISSNSSLSDEEYVTVTVSGVLLPSEHDWVAMLSSSNSDASSCPFIEILYLQTGDVSTLPLLCHYPVKAQYMSNDPDYLSCKKEECKKYSHDVCVLTTCSGWLSFHVINIRTNIEFVLFAGGFDTPCILKRSNPLSFANPKMPLYGHLSSIDSTGTSMRITWVSGDKEPQLVQYEDGKSQTSEVTTFTQDDMCSSALQSPAKDFGWHDPGYIHTAVMTGLQPSSTFSYRFGRDYTGSGSVYITPDSGGECGVAYETYFPMPTSAKDKPWYSIEQASVHFTVISTEHDWKENSEQYKWIKNDMASVDRSKTPWLIFMGHRPMYSSTDELFNVDAQFVQAVEPLLLANKVDLALFGHIHNYERTCAVYKKQCMAMPVKDDNGIDTYDNSNYTAPIQAVIGMAGFKLDEFSNNDNIWSLSRISEFGYVRIHATEDDLKFEFVNSSTRKVEDSFRITKSQGS